MNTKRKLVRKFDYWTRKKRRQLVYFICWLTGGHQWSPWKPTAAYSLGETRSVNNIRECLCCEKQESTPLDPTIKAHEPQYF